MNPEQGDAFQAGAGYSMDDLSLVLMLVICTVVLLWDGWVLLNAFKGWANRVVSAQAFFKAALRVVLVSSIILFIAAT